MVNIKLLFIILDEGYDKKIRNILNKFGIKVKTVSNAKGTASSSILDYFGLSETEKEVFIAIVPEYSSYEILLTLKNYFNLTREGTGIAFTIPITSSNKYLSDSFLKNNLERNEINMQNNNFQYHLIITIVSEGYLEQVMSAAKRAGASGGTAIKGRGLADYTSAKILGFSIEPEKDIVLNVVSQQDKTKVMEEITKAVGIKTKGKGLCVSLPVDSIIGLDIANINQN